MSLRVGSRLTAAAVVAVVSAPSVFAFRTGAEVEGSAGVPPAARGLAQRVGDTLTTAAGRLSAASPAGRAGAARLASTSSNGDESAAGLQDDSATPRIPHSVQRHTSGAAGTMPSMPSDARGGVARGFSTAAKVDERETLTVEPRSTEEWAKIGIERLQALKVRVDKHHVFSRLTEDEWKELMEAFSDSVHAGHLGESFGEVRFLERSLDFHDSGPEFFGDGTTEEDFKIWSALAVRHLHHWASRPTVELPAEPHDDTISEKERALWLAAASDVHGESDAVANTLAKFSDDSGVQTGIPVSRAPAKAPSSPTSSAGGAKRAFSSKRDEPEAGMLHSLKARVGELWKAVAGNFEEKPDVVANASATVKQDSDVQGATGAPQASAKAPSPPTSSSGGAKRSFSSSPVGFPTVMDRVDNFLSMLKQNTAAASLWLMWRKFKVDEMPLEVKFSDSTDAIDGALATAVQDSPPDVAREVMGHVHHLILRATTDRNKAKPEFTPNLSEWFRVRNSIMDELLRMTMLSQQDAAQFGRWVQARMLVEDISKDLKFTATDMAALKEAVALAAEKHADQEKVLIELERLHKEATMDKKDAWLLPKEAWSHRFDKTVDRLRHLAETATPTGDF